MTRKRAVLPATIETRIYADEWLIASMGTEPGEAHCDRLLSLEARGYLDRVIAQVLREGPARIAVLPTEKRQEAGRWVYVASATVERS